MAATENEIEKKTTNSKTCVIVPTYNNEKTLAKVVTELKTYSRSIIVVNDGSTDSTVALLNAIEHITVCSLPHNKGKGYALRTGFEKAIAMGFDYAVTIDGDGQHHVPDILSLLEKSNENPSAIIIGSRDLQAENMPGKNTFANKFSNFWFWVETGWKVADTQSGFRLYPLSAIAGRKYFTRRYDFELEVLVRAAWGGTPPVSVPIQVTYAPKTEQISHFKPVRDFTKISLLNTVLVLIAFLWIKPRQSFRKINKKSIRTFLKEQIFATSDSNKKIALSVTLGTFMGIIPFWGYQMLIAYTLAHLLKLNKSIALVASNISVPPLIPFILYGSYRTGAWIMNNPTDLAGNTISFEGVKQNLLQYLIGSFVLATVFALSFGIICYLLLKIFRKKDKT